MTAGGGLPLVVPVPSSASSGPVAAVGEIARGPPVALLDEVPGVGAVIAWLRVGCWPVERLPAGVELGVKVGVDAEAWVVEAEGVEPDVELGVAARAVAGVFAPRDAVVVEGAIAAVLAVAPRWLLRLPWAFFSWPGGP